MSWVNMVIIFIWWIFKISTMSSQYDYGIALIEYDDMDDPKAKGLFALTGRNPIRLFLIISGSMSQKYF